MDAQRTLEVLAENYYLIKVVFENSGKEYTYKVPSDVKTEVGGLVIVDSPSSNYTLVTVTQVDSECRIVADDPIRYKWIVCAVDDTAYKARLDQQEAFSNLLDKANRKAAKAQMLANLSAQLGDDSELLAEIKTFIE